MSLHRALALLLLLALAGCEAQPPFGCDFEREADLDALSWECGRLFSLSDRHVSSGRSSLRAELHPSPPGADGDYPGLAFSGFDPDWSEAEALTADVFLAEKEPVRLVVRIDDRGDSPPYADRFNRAFPLSPGPNRIEIPLGGLRTSGTGRALDLRRITAVYFFLVRPERKVTLYFDRIRLVP